MKNKQILVTGGTGLLGRSVIQILKQKGYRVTAIDLFKRDIKGVEVIQGDFANRHLVHELLKDTDAVIHLAAMLGVDNCRLHPDQVIKVNYENTKNNLPTDLVYMAMIESGFNTSAYSRARAVGPWQFIKGTASRYGLKINWWVDERRDPTKSTLAASMYLKDLYDMFDSWLLAAAGYNAGENKIKRAIVKHNTEDFWEMTNHRYLRKETKQYIPKLIAAALIAKNPPKYGFTNLEYQDPLEFETITVTEPTDLRTLAQMLVSPYEDIKILNPELLRWCTPPDTPEYTLRIPKGKKEVFEAKALEGEPQSKEKTIFHSHKIKQGDTLYQIARTYGIQVSPIIEMNKLKSTHTLRPGQFLIIPVKAKSSDQQT